FRTLRSEEPLGAGRRVSAETKACRRIVGRPDDDAASEPMTHNANEDRKPADRLKRKDYERELARLHVELVKLQQWVVHEGIKVCIVFEGRDGAGKGGTIKALTERVSPRIFRVVALPAPTEREK